MKLKKAILVILLAVFLVLSVANYGKVFADESLDNVYETYTIFDENGDFLIEKQGVLEGDGFLTKDFKKYDIIKVDNENRTGTARLVGEVEKPKINKSFSSSQISQISPTICLYMTHNDESYQPTDGYYSTYGKGGVHDVAKAIRQEFENRGVNVQIDETLHLPHDNYAYSRSKTTAQNLITAFSPDAIFDIHRDGASRSTYVKKIDGTERCKVRIVVGKKSENFAIAEQFAMYLLSVSESTCPWLFLDIYYASGHYNQGLHEKALLFEMGSHLVEKELVLKTVKPLVETINTALFNTTLDRENGELTISGAVSEATPILNDALTEMKTEKPADYTALIVVGLILGAVAVVVLALYLEGRKEK